MSDDRRPGPTNPQPGSDAPTGRQRGTPSTGIEVAGLTDNGRVRPANEDNLTFEEPSSPLARSQGTLLVVSDGMGGHAAGEVASQIAVETIHAAYYRQGGMPAADALRDAITAANSAIYDAAQQNTARAGMGCTVVALVVQGADLTIGHVGDSRAYLIRSGQSIPLTMDHSWVAMQVREGILTPEQAERHPNRSVLMRALGRQPAVEVDVAQRKLQTGDVLLLCSDGLTGVVTDAEIAEYASRIPAAALPKQLVDLANQRGAPDNVTVLVGAITSTPVAAHDFGSDATTIIPPRSQTPVDQASGDPPTDRQMRRPASPGPNAATNATLAGPSRTTPSGEPTATAPAGAAFGKPVVVSRSSVTQADGTDSPRRGGRGRWIAGAVAAFGLAGALILLAIFQLTRSNPPAATVASSTATPATAARPAGAPPATIPPPISTVLPGVAGAPPAAAPAIANTPTPLPSATVQAPAASPTAAAPATAVATGTATATPSPTISLPSIPGIPSIRDFLSTATPTPDAASSAGEPTDAPPENPTDAPAGSASGGAAPATADPAAAEPGPAPPPPHDGPPAAPPDAAPGAAPAAGPPPPQAQPQPKPGGGILEQIGPRLGPLPSDDDDDD